jgi:hypothetical protein
MKQLGFNENCYRVGNPNGAICWRFMDVAGVEGVGIDDILQVYFDERWAEIPTFSQSFRWFREKYNINTVISWRDDLLNYDISLTEMKKHGCFHYTDNFNTYEEAEIGCLEKLIEIVEFKLNVK